MKVPEAEGLEGRPLASTQDSYGQDTMGDVQPPGGTQEETRRDGTQTSLQRVDSRQEIESVDSGPGVNNKDVQINLKETEGAFTEVSYAGPSSRRFETSEEVGARIDDVDSSRLNDTSGAERAGNVEALEGRDFHVKEISPPLNGSGTAEGRYQLTFGTTGTPLPDKSRGSHLIDIPLREAPKVEELDTYKAFSIVRTASNFSVESGTGDQCRICQQHTEEPLMELGCHCRGELAKAHRSCIDHWFGNKGTNKCEVCQHVATNVPVPSSQPTPHFWVWRVGGAYNGAAPRRAGGARFHPLWAALLILIAGLLFDILISIFLGASALPVNIIIGVLVVLGLGTAARLVLECWHERVIRRNIRRMEEEPNFEDIPAGQTNVSIQVDPVEAQPPATIVSPQTAAVQGSTEDTHVSNSASTMVTP